MRIIHLIFVVALTTLPMQRARAETIDEALALAYSNNPTLNAQRAATRSVDENVPIALSGYRPRVFGTGDYGISKTDRSGFTTVLRPGGFGVTVSQTLWDSFKTRNDVEAARSSVLASRETLRNTEQNVLFDAASAYMDVIRDQAITVYRGQSLEFLDELVRSETARFDVGESTRTDVAQAEASRAQARADLSLSRAQLNTSIAVYRQIIGVEPRNLRAPRDVYRLVPRPVNRALEIAFAEHPAIQATRYLVDQADWTVKSAESELLPTVTLEGSASRRYDSIRRGDVTDSSQITAQLRVPIYQGGVVSSTVRQNKEILGQRRIEVDETVDNVRAAAVSAFGQLEGARATSVASEAQLRAARLALEGSTEERKVGQRTTLDVLEAQQEVINAQVTLASTQRDIVVASYAVLSAVGRLSAENLGLSVIHYDPIEHYEIVKDKWFGLRTPDGR